MKRILCYGLAAALTITTAFACVQPQQVSAAQKGDVRQRIERLKPGKEKIQYKEGQALVLFKSAKTSTKAKAKVAVGMPEDAEVQEFWDFSMPEKRAGSGARTRAAGNTSLNIALVRSDKLTTKELITKLKKRPDVETAEPNYKIKALSTVNDTYFSHQWALENTGQNGGTPGKSINAAAKWNKGVKGSKDKVVAIVDTGVDYTHEDLKDNIWENTYQPDLKGEHGFDFIQGDDDPMDENGHGTHCAGIIGAKGDNSTGVSGVNQNVKIMALRILDASGSGWGSDEIGAYHYINKALDLGVNVVAINNSWGGGDYSEIFEKLVNLVGEKGAVTVCAAGNESSDNDDVGTYPANVESPYKLSVAASNEKNELANFSNYGKASVDLAAPGADILSTVSYDCYNPSLYDSTKQEALSKNFNNYEDDANTWGIPDQKNFSTSGSATFSVEWVSDKYFGTGVSGKSLKLSFKDMKKGQWAAIRIPHSYSKALKQEERPYVSMQIRGDAPGSADSICLAADVPKDTPIPDDPFEFLFTYEPSGSYIRGEQNCWNHYSFQSAQWEGDLESGDRDLCLVIWAEASGDYTLYLDDLGISKDNPDTAKFGKYDYYNGTSMAAPAVTGAIALAAAENPKAGSEELISQVLSCVQAESGLESKVSIGGALDLSKMINAGPRLGAISVNAEAKQIILKGSGFDTPDLKVTVNGQPAQVLKKTKNQVIIQDSGWINRIVTVAVTGVGNKTITKKDVYLVKGKASYSKVEGMEFPQGSDGLATDGIKIYKADSASDCIMALNTAQKKAQEFEPICMVNAEKYFTKDKNSLADFDFQFGKDLVYADRKLYNIVAYSEVSMSGGGDMDDDAFFFDDEGMNTSGNSPAYSSQYKLMSFDLTTKKTADLGKLPSDMKRIDDWTLASYNGKLYLIGGYDYAKKAVSRKVKIYDPSKKKWTAGPSLPEGRALGKALQSGNSLVYTLGYGEGQKSVDIEKQTCPNNLILKGTSWKTSSETMAPYIAEDFVTRSGHTYQVYGGSIGLCAGGLVYAGLPADGLGDTFTYSISADTFIPTKYSHITEPYGGIQHFAGIAAGSAFYGTDESGEAYKVAVKSGLVKVTAPKMKGGTITGANKGYMPGAKVTLKANPKSGYYVKSFKVNGKTVTGTSKTMRLVSGQKVSASFAPYKLTLNKKELTLKSGRSYKLKASITPSKAKKKVSYSSSNKKYATVTSKGVIRAKAAGIGKTVKITVKVNGDSKKKAVCKVKITR